MWAKVRYAVLVRVTTFRFGFSWCLIPYFFSFLNCLLSVVLTRFFRISDHLFRTSGEEDGPYIRLFTLVYPRASGDSNVIDYLFNGIFLGVTVNCYYFMYRELIRLSSGMVLRIFKGSSTVTNNVTSGLIFLQGRFSVQTFIRDIRCSVEVFVFQRDRTRGSDTFHQNRFHRSIVFNRVCFVVVEDNSLPFINGPTYTLFFIGLQFTCCKRSERLSMIIGPQAKLVHLLRATGLIDNVDMLPTIARFSYLQNPRIRPPKANGNQVDVAY